MELIFAAIAIIGTSIGAFTDIRTRLVPDWTSYFMLAAGLGGNAILSLLSNSIWPIVYSAIGAGIFFAIGYLLYKVGVWGGGDAKLLPAIGALVGFEKSIAIWPFLVSYWLNLLILGAVFGILGMMFLLIKHRKETIRELKLLINKYKLPFYATLSASILLGVSAIFIPHIILGFVLAILGLMLFVLKATEKASLHKIIAPHKLVEGDWLIEDVKIGNYCYHPKKIGIEKSDIEKMIALEKSGRLKDVKIKDGVPYVPAFLGALIVSLLGFDIFFWMMTSLMI